MPTTRDYYEILGVERNESVGNSHISYGGATLASNLMPALEIYADLLRRPLMPADQIEAGRKVVLQELEGIEDEPSHKVMLELRRHHYPEPYGRSSQGERAAIESITIDEIRDHYFRAVRPGGTILGVAGQLDWPRLVDHVLDALLQVPHQRAFAQDGQVGLGLRAGAEMRGAVDVLDASLD